MPANGRVMITGFVRDLSGVANVTLNGDPVSLDENGRFAHEVPVTPGLNFFDLEAADNLAQSTRSLCGFFAASTYKSANTVLENTIRLDLRQGAVDDGDNGGPIRSFGDIARVPFAPMVYAELLMKRSVRPTAH